LRISYYVMLGVVRELNGVAPELKGGVALIGVVK
jgi:hypothetical protein